MLLNEKISDRHIKKIGDILGIDWDRSKFDLDQFRRGIEIEFEHLEVANADIFKIAEIALDHLNEFPDYYDRLDKMEKEAEDYWAGREIPIQESYAENRFVVGSSYYPSYQVTNSVLGHAIKDTEFVITQRFKKSGEEYITCVELSNPKRKETVKILSGYFPGYELSKSIGYYGNQMIELSSNNFTGKSDISIDDSRPKTLKQLQDFFYKKGMSRDLELEKFSSNIIIKTKKGSNEPFSIYLPGDPVSMNTYDTWLTYLISRVNDDVERNRDIVLLKKFGLYDLREGKNIETKITIEEDVVVNENILLEKGDVIKVLEEKSVDFICNNEGSMEIISGHDARSIDVSKGDGFILDPKYKFGEDKWRYYGRLISSARYRVDPNLSGHKYDPKDVTDVVGKLIVAIQKNMVTKKENDFWATWDKVK